MFYSSSRHASPGALLTSLVPSAGQHPDTGEPIDSDRLTAAARSFGNSGWLHRNRINILLLLLAALAALSTTFHLMAPVLAESLANGLPASWVRTSSEQILSELDGKILLPSTVPLSRQDDLRERFAALNPAPEGAPPYRLLFRDSRWAGATLLSLPGGEIIVTDDFLRNVPERNEQLALLCHELGHLYHYHALRNAIEHELPRLAWAAFIGSSDASIRALTVGLREADFSLQYVEEADRYAASMLQANHIPTSVLIHAIEHGQRPLESASNSGTTSHRQYFAERINMLQNFR
jgi:Zn-dependent protease with chaperone function